MNGADFGIGVGCKKAEQLMLAFDRLGFGAAFAVPARPYASEKRQGPILIEREPGRRLARFGVGVFAKGIEGDNAAVFRLEPRAPMRTSGIAYVRNRRSAKLRRPRHAPQCQHQFPNTVWRVAQDRRHLIGKHPGMGGRLPVLSRSARVSSMIAAWLLVTE
jgi:hypothetical protein